MNDMIEEIIEKKPHLADPFKFYQKELDFIETARELSVTANPGQTAYGPDIIERIFERFSSFLGLPEEILSPLKHAMELREIDFSRLPLGETPAFSLPYPEDDLAILLYLLSKPYFLAKGDACNMHDLAWQEGKCPACKGQPSISWISADGRRQVSCSYCRTSGYVPHAGCPVCLEQDREKQHILEFEGETGFTINTCDLCHSYVKTVDPGIHERYSSDIADLMSLPLDIIVQEKGYMRRSPNPIGMRKITMRG